MSKVMRLTERDLTKLVSRIINEQPKLNAYGEKIPKHPTDSKLWINMKNDIEGDGVSIIKETPNLLMIQGVTGDWTITFKR
jgi:hypothetical protein